MPAHRLLLIALITGLVVLSSAGQVIWRPWVSPRYAAFELADYDGKGLTIWIPAAAKFWGSRIYVPLAEATNQFEDFGWSLQETLTEILLGEKAGNVADVSALLLDSQNAGSRMVGFLAAKKHGIPVPGQEALEAQIRELAAKEVATNDRYTILALEIVGHLGLPGMLPVIARQAQRQQVPSGVRTAACIALERIPERSEAEELLGHLRMEGICPEVRT